MPNFSLSNWAKAQLIATDEFQETEMKHVKATAMSLFMDKRDFTIDNLRGLRYREDRPQEAYFLTRQKRTTTGSSRNFQHTGQDGDSQKIDILFDPYVDRFSVSIKRTDNNLYNFEQTLAHNMKNAFLNIYEDVEVSALAYLDANKTTVNRDPRLGTFNQVNNVFETSAANSSAFFRNNKSMMRRNLYRSTSYNVLADPSIAALAEFQSVQGGGNQTNLGYQFLGVNLAESTQLSDANYENGLAYWTAPGTIAVIDWIPKQNREGFGNMENATKDNPYFTSMIHPLLGIPLAVHIYKEGADTSATNGSEQDVVWQFEVSVDLSFNHAPLTNAGETPIFATGITA